MDSNKTAPIHPSLFSLPFPTNLSFSTLRFPPLFTSDSNLYSQAPLFNSFESSSNDFDPKISFQTILPLSSNTPGRQSQESDLHSFGTYCKSILETPKENNVKRAPMAKKKHSFSIESERKESVEDKKSLRIDLDDEDEEDSEEEADHKNSPKKYLTYSKESKQKIVDYVNQYGIDEAYKTFKKEHPKLTKRRLSQWQANIHKKKNTKGKKTNDPVRDEALQSWYRNYVEHYKVNPTRREIQEKALQISETPDFMASKGWVDKICVRLNFEVTKVKCKTINSKPKKKVKTQEPETAITSRKASIESEDRETPSNISEAPMSFAEPINTTCDISSFFDFTKSSNNQESFEKIDEIPSLESMMSLLERI